MVCFYCSFVTLLEYAEEALKCTHVIVCFKKARLRIEGKEILGSPIWFMKLALLRTFLALIKYQGNQFLVVENWATKFFLSKQPLVVLKVSFFLWPSPFSNLE